MNCSNRQPTIYSIFEHLQETSLQLEKQAGSFVLPPAEYRKLLPQSNADYRLQGVDIQKTFTLGLSVLKTAYFHRGWQGKGSFTWLRRVHTTKHYKRNLNILSKLCFWTTMQSEALDL